MENTPTGCGSDLPSILRTFKNDPKSRSVNNFLECSDVDPNSRKQTQCGRQLAHEGLVKFGSGCPLRGWGCPFDTCNNPKGIIMKCRLGRQKKREGKR